MNPTGALTLAWGFDFAIGLVVALTGFFVHLQTREMTKRSVQVDELSHRIVVLEERERGLAAQVGALKEVADLLATDVRFVREKIIVLVNQAGAPGTEV